MKKLVDNVNNVASAPADDVFEAIHNVMHLYRSQQYRVLREGACELTHMEVKVLGFFARRPGASLSDLVAHSGRDKGQLARLIAGLRERGLLEAQTDSNDRRSLRLQPTLAGKALQHTLLEQGQSVAAIAVKGLSTAQRQELLALLTLVQANLETGPR